MDKVIPLVNYQRESQKTFKVDQGVMHVLEKLCQHADLYSKVDDTRIPVMARNISELKRQVAFFKWIVRLQFILLGSLGLLGAYLLWWCW